jgi:hypothetical protein
LSSTDPYEILGVPRSATKAEIKSAYRRLARALHPDNKETGSHEAFVRLGAAFEYVEARFSCRRSAGPSRRRTPPPPRDETFEEFMARTRGNRKRFTQEREEYFRHTHARAPFRLLLWRLSHDLRTAAHELAKLLRRKRS